jgi:tRNA threonylcarbamoyladenosine biosynthesis protein TsaB
MCLILNIEVSGKTGFVSLAKNGIVIQTITNDNPMQHASFLQPAIKKIIGENNISINSINAIALSNGPGSYTGLRVGLASAKGLAFSLGIPLITINTLQVMALGAGMEIEHSNSRNNANKIFPNFIDESKEDKQQGNTDHVKAGKKFLICPLVDARRMEVFFGLYNNENEVIIPPSAAILDEDFIFAFLKNSVIFFTGSGAHKLKKLINHSHACFLPETLWDKAFGKLSYNFFRNKTFSDINLAEPFYCKEFYDATVRG